MWSNFSLALTTLFLVLVTIFVWTLVIFTGGDSIALEEVNTLLAIRSFCVCSATFILLFVTSQLPVRRPIVVKLMLGFSLFFFGAWQEFLSTLVVNSWFATYWLDALAMPLGIIIAAAGLYELGKAYQLNRLLLGSYRKIEHSLATVDQLTQLYNRRYFFATCPELMQKLRQDKITFTMICLRLTNLPEINLSIGFQAGDALLSQTAKQLLRHIRTGDIAARLSGRRFAIFLPDTSMVEAEEMVQRFLSQIEHVLLHNLAGEEKAASAKLDFAICTAQPDEDFETLLCRTKAATTQQEHN